VLIVEALSEGPMSRPEIRALVYGDSVLFRINRAAYVDALGALQESGRVVVRNRQYSLTGDRP
jgi:hypothetical protein